MLEGTVAVVADEGRQPSQIGPCLPDSKPVQRQTLAPRTVSETLITSPGDFALPGFGVAAQPVSGEVILVGEFAAALVAAEFRGPQLVLCSQMSPDVHSWTCEGLIADVTSNVRQFPRRVQQVPVRDKVTGQSSGLPTVVAEHSRQSPSVLHRPVNG